MADLITEWFMEPSVRANYRTMVYYPGAGQDTFDINFEGGYINRSDVKAFMVKDDTRDRVNLGVTFVGGSTSRVKVSQVVPKGWTVCIFRDTPKAKPLAQFTDGAIINEKNLDRNAQQAMFAVSEMVDRFDSTVDSVESALKEVYEANQKSEQAIKTANEAKVIAQGAVQTANSAVTKADQAISTANTASSKADGAIKTANEAKSIAQGLDAQIKAANATSAKAVETANQANATANNALKVANGIDAKATQALNNSTTALNTANGVDAKATQAQKDAKEALEKANTAINTGNVAKGLTDRVEGYPTSVNVAWKGKHQFRDRIEVREYGIHQDALPFGALQFNGTDKSVRLINAANSTYYYSLIIHPDGKLTYSGDDILVNRYTSPNFTNSVNINSSANNSSIALKNTGNNTQYTIKNAGSTLFFSRLENGSETGYASLPSPGKGEFIAYQSYVHNFVARRGNFTYLHSMPGSHVEYRLDETTNTAELWMRGKLVQKTGSNYISAYSDSQYCGLRAYRNDNTHITIETAPYKGTPNFGNIINRDTNGNVSVLGLPNKNGSLAIASEHYTKQETDKLLGSSGGSGVATIDNLRVDGTPGGEWATKYTGYQELSVKATGSDSYLVFHVDLNAQGTKTPAGDSEHCTYMELQLELPSGMTKVKEISTRHENWEWKDGQNTKVSSKRMPVMYVKVPANTAGTIRYRGRCNFTTRRTDGIKSFSIDAVITRIVDNKTI